jgi:predicted amidohydrolase YtcJ
VPSGDADLVFVGGRVYGTRSTGRPPEAVAVRQGRIAAVGGEEDIRSLIGRKTEVVNLNGGMLLPGFQDAHVHAQQGGLERLRCDLISGDTERDYLQLIGEYARANPNAEWILGGGWSMPAFPGGLPNRASLDPIVPDRPVFLPNRDHHSAWVNSRALGQAGITADTADPPGGRIERGWDGEPTGVLHESAMRLVEDMVPPTDVGELRRALLLAQTYLHSLGVTAWQDAWVGSGPSMVDSYDTYRQLDSHGLLTARVVGALWWQRDGDSDQLPGLIERRAETLEAGGRFRATSVKIMQDGVCETFTAAMLDPYLDEHGRETDNRGLSFIDPEALASYVTALDATGFQVHFHAIGDRATREALDAIDAARRANGRNDLRHHLAHLQVVHPDDYPRFAELGAAATVQPLWACLDPQMVELTLPFLGPDRTALQYPFGSLATHGAYLAFGSDWPVSSPDPLELLHVAVNRTEPGTAPAGQAFLPEERLTLDQSLQAYTMGSAYVNHLDPDTGSIEAGKFADLVVLDRDLAAAGSGDLLSGTVQLTLVAGEKVFEAAQTGG